MFCKYLFPWFNRDMKCFAIGLFITVLASCTHPPLYKLEVENGTGSGYYEAGQVVNIAALGSADKRFVSWDGDLLFLHDPKASETYITMPDRNTEVSAYLLPTGQASFRFEVYPIIRLYCVLSGCHLDSYRHANFLNYWEVANSRSKMESYLKNGFMPLNSTMPEQDKNLILLWIEQGAKNN